MGLFLNMMNRLQVLADLLLPSGNIIVGDANGKAASVTMSGDATISNTGVLTLKNIAIAKAADETVNNSDTLQDDDELKFDAKANTKYNITIFLFLNSSGVADFKYDFSIPAGASGDMQTGNWSSSGSNDATDIGTPIVVATTAVVRVTCILARMEIAATAGEVAFQWAQNTAEVSNTIVKAGTCLSMVESV